MLPSHLMKSFLLILKLNLDPFIPYFLTSFCTIPPCPLTHCGLVTFVSFQFLQQVKLFPTWASYTFCSFCLQCVKPPLPLLLMASLFFF